jgi:hypothetical protein
MIYFYLKSKLQRLNNIAEKVTMPRKDQSEWLSGKEAADILTKKSGHEVKQNYVRLLALQGKIAQRAKDGRTNEYRRSDVERITVRSKTPKSEAISS